MQTPMAQPQGKLSEAPYPAMERKLRYQNALFPVGMETATHYKLLESAVIQASLNHETKTIRLANGKTPYEGRIEVFTKGVWGLITDYSYSNRPVHNAIAAGLACRNLFGPDYGGSVVPKEEASVRFGVPRGRAILMSNIVCNGNEKSLLDCDRSTTDTSTTLEDSLSVVCKTVPKGCNGYLEIATGNLTSPGYPQSKVYTTDTDCVWKIVNKVAKIRLSFTKVDFNGSTLTTSNSLEVFDSNGYLSLSSVTSSTNVTSSSSEIYVWLKVPSGSEGIQFHVNWDAAPCFESISSSGYIRSPGYPQQYPTNLNCTYHLLKRRGLHASISFSNFALSNMVQGVCGDYLQVFDGDTELSPSIRGPLCNTTRPATITTTNVNSTKVIVKFTSDAVNTSVENGFEAYFRSLEPDPIRPGNYTEDSGTFTTPGYPNVYNGEEDVIWTITTKPYKTITINFHHVHLKGCCNDYIMIYDQVRSTSYYGGNIPSFATDTNSVQVTMQSSLDNEMNVINASWITECRQVFTAFSGSILSPNDTTFDSASADCTYIIRQQPGYYITLQFSTINFERDIKCSNYIEIHDGSTDLFPLLGERYCGQTLPPTLNSTQNIVLLKFATQTGKNSFSLRYSSHPKECSSGLMKDSDGSFTSPGFPLGYPSNTYCVWTINLDQKDLQIELTFDDFSVGSQGTQCQYAFVRVYDADTVDANKVMPTLCGTTLPTKLRSTGHSMTVVLNVFGSLTNANGFRATYAGRRLNGLFPYGTAARDRALGSNTYETMEVTIEDGFPFGDSLREAVYIGTNGIISFQKGSAWPRLDPTSVVVCVYCAYISNIQGVYYHLYNDVSENRGVLEKASSEVQDFTGMFSFSARTVLVVTWDRVQQSFPSLSMGDSTFQVALVTDGAASYAIVQYRLGNKGSWIYELGRIPSDYRQVCRDWHSRNKVYEKRKERETGFANLPQCPCSRRGFFRHIVNQWRFHRSDEQNHFECYILNVARTRLFAPLGKECCYSTDPLKPEQMDMLITSRPFAGASLAYNPLIFEQTDLYETEDRLAHVACCLNSPDRFCRRFYQLRPVGDCDPNPALGWSPLYGDPHVTTLDGRQYIFNGLGEFTMATVRTAHVTFTLQARTQRAELRPGTPTNGTVFTAVGAEENGVRVFLQIDPNTNTSKKSSVCARALYHVFCVVSALILFANNIDYTRQLQQEGDNFVLDHEGAVDNSSTVMRYEARMGPKDYNHHEFQPVFLDELDPVVRREAEGLCGTQNLPCIYDFLATGNKDFALSTADQQKLSDDLMKQSKNSLPSVKVPAAAYVTVGVQKTVFIKGSDPDVNDRLTYRIVDDAKGAVNINSSSGAITIFLKTLDPIKIQVYVVDEVGGQSTVESLPLVVCSGCEGHGLCNESDPRDVSGDSYFQYAVCQCQPAWSGNNCELDKDGCSDNPCHPLQTCADVPANEQGSSDVGYRCSDCPPGFSSRNGSQDCIDIDECGNKALDKCDMICINTYGGYECSCQEGFRLSTDGRTCADVNECLESTHDCRQVCNNTEGGYRCECAPGYSYDEITKDCIIDSSLSGVCQASGCSQGCSVATDPSSSSSSSNSIPLCFCYQGYDLDPRDNKTCVDRDECRDKVCDQVCNNTAGGFSCSCYDGFALNKDERTCSACPYLKYGPECRQTCTCSGRSVACHPVRGCVCQDGWTGKSCEEDVDECAENPDVCGTQKRCVNNKGSYSCVCRPGYATTDDGVCQDIDECKLNISDCQQECVNVPGYFNCDCKYGYRLTADRRHCSKVNECTNSLDHCEMLCENTYGSYFCYCKQGYRLNNDNRTCSDINECTEHSDNCPQTCHNIDGGYRCACEDGYIYDDATNKCKIDPTVQNVCRISSCSKYCRVKQDPSTNSSIPECFCDRGYELDSKDNQTCKDHDECNDSLCTQLCTNTDGSFSCSCNRGYTLNDDGRTCSPCPHLHYGVGCHEVCRCRGRGKDCDKVRGCICNDGWTGSQCQDDIDECAGNSSICGQEGICINNLGSYTCLCRPGYQDDGQGNCTDINECTNGLARCSGICNNTDGGYVCSCPAGEKLDADGKTCKGFESFNFYRQGLLTVMYTLMLIVLIPPACPNGTYGENCTHTCNCGRGAERRDNEIGCVCRPGWQGTDCDTDTDECLNQDVTDNCTLTHAVCVNSPGGYKCECHVGFLRDQFGVCQDINECPSSPCSQGCINTNGSYTCTCHSGFQFNTTIKDCEDINECLNSPCSQGCVNTKGSYTCTCYSGFKINSATKDCEDVDECLNSPCTQLCTNIDGDYYCSCSSGYMLVENGKCEAITSIALTISINIVVNVSDLVNEKSNEYQKWNESVTNSLEFRTEYGSFMVLVRTLIVFLTTVIKLIHSTVSASSQLTQYFSTNVVGFMSFVVTKLRAGSVIADGIATTKSSSVGSLTVAMLHLTGSRLTINNQTGDVQVAVQQNLAQSKSKCELFELISPCGEGTECDSTAEVPICRTVENSRSWVLITSLAVGIPAGICLVLIVSCCLVRHKRKTSKRAKNNTSTEEIPRSRSSSQAHAYDTLQPAFSTIPRIYLQAAYCKAQVRDANVHNILEPTVEFVLVLVVAVTTSTYMRWFWKSRAVVGGYGVFVVTL
ncbi:hypothetical protein C0Q70_02978 [Pomacea canaliculata]|uniref:Cubilin n=1 Tax=Pomacea canaliculata TaxID=400727 RepID=A0A2T7PRG2_POMCA|nr:hypothetical protein C0Q70_02978 [Pomacea canaliculata]